MYGPVDPDDPGPAACFLCGLRLEVVAPDRTQAEVWHLLAGANGPYPLAGWLAGLAETAESHVATRLVRAGYLYEVVDRPIFGRRPRVRHLPEDSTRCESARMLLGDLASGGDVLAVAGRHHRAPSPQGHAPARYRDWHITGLTDAQDAYWAAAGLANAIGGLRGLLGVSSGRWKRSFCCGVTSCVVVSCGRR
jgi:hypothetical protein